MTFSLSVGGFFQFITKPFHSVIGWILIIATAIYIYLRITGKIGYKRDKQQGNNQTTYDYIDK